MGIQSAGKYFAQFHNICTCTLSSWSSSDAMTALMILLRAAFLLGQSRLAIFANNAEVAGGGPSSPSRSFPGPLCNISPCKALMIVPESIGVAPDRKTLTTALRKAFMGGLPRIKAVGIPYLDLFCASAVLTKAAICLTVVSYSPLNMSCRRVSSHQLNLRDVSSLLSCRFRTETRRVCKLGRVNRQFAGCLPAWVSIRRGSRHRRYPVPYLHL